MHSQKVSKALGSRRKRYHVFYHAYYVGHKDLFVFVGMCSGFATTSHAFQSYEYVLLFFHLSLLDYIIS